MGVHEYVILKLRCFFHEKNVKFVVNEMITIIELNNASEGVDFGLMDS
jgi:hypothetical protein